MTSRCKQAEVEAQSAAKILYPGEKIEAAVSWRSGTARYSLARPPNLESSSSRLGHDSLMRRSQHHFGPKNCTRERTDRSRVVDTGWSPLRSSSVENLPELRRKSNRPGNYFGSGGFTPMLCRSVSPYRRIHPVNRCRPDPSRHQTFGDSSIALRGKVKSRHKQPGTTHPASWLDRRVGSKPNRVLSRALLIVDAAPRVWLRELR